jgi:hypothetical protein
MFVNRFRNQNGRLKRIFRRECFFWTQVIEKEDAGRPRRPASWSEKLAWIPTIPD